MFNHRKLPIKANGCNVNRPGGLRDWSKISDKMGSANSDTNANQLSSMTYVPFVVSLALVLS